MHRTLQSLAAGGEALTGLLLALLPAVPVRWLFGSGLSGVAEVATRVAGIALLSLGVASWPSTSGANARVGLLLYNALAGAYFVLLGVNGEWRGPLLWPAAALHAGLALLLGIGVLRGAGAPR